MPLYEYKCQSCGHTNEFLMKMSDPAPEACLVCGADSLKKMMSKTSFVLKGTGWYETDFKHGGKPKPVGETATQNEAGSKSDPASSKDGSSSAGESGKANSSATASGSASGSSSSVAAKTASNASTATSAQV